MIKISNNVYIHDDELDIKAIRAQGAGGQNVNKVSTAVHLRFDIQSSTLPEFYKKRLLYLKDKRITRDGVIIIKSQRFRSQDKNRQDAIERLQTLIKSVLQLRKKRIATRPTLSSQHQRLDSKTKRGYTKKLRRKTLDLND